MMTAMVELDETRMCNLLGNELAQLPRNEEIIRGSNQQRRVSDTPQAFSGIISEQRIDAHRRDFLRRMPGRAAPIKTHLLVQRSLAENEQLAHRPARKSQSISPASRTSGWRRLMISSRGGRNRSSWRSSRGWLIGLPRQRISPSKESRTAQIRNPKPQ
jgi:hypothetical protein